MNDPLGEGTYQSFPAFDAMSPPDPDQDQDYRRDGGGAALATQAAKPKLAPPPQYKVVMLNDDYTPMEFVVDVLQRFFRHDHDAAIRIMLAVHQAGKGVAGIYPLQVAETKVAQVNTYARKNQHPLMTVLEKS